MRTCQNPTAATTRGRKRERGRGGWCFFVCLRERKTEEGGKIGVICRDKISGGGEEKEEEGDDGWWRGYRWVVEREEEGEGARAACE